MAIHFTIQRNDRDFYCRADGGPRFFVGRQVVYQNRVGLMNDHQSSIRQLIYEPEQYRALHGIWADLIGPTATAESRSSFLVVNSYDRAGFTFGFLQFAAHVADGDFVRWFRAMLGRAEALDYFPNLIVKGSRIFSIELDGDVQLESAESTALLQRHLNEATDLVDDREIIATAKLIHWTVNHSAARDLQVQHAVVDARKRVIHAHQRLDLTGRSATLCAVVMDILHQGRGRFPDIDAALRAADPLARLLEIGKERYGSRIVTLRARLKATPSLDEHVWAPALQDFVGAEATGA